MSNATEDEKELARWAIDQVRAHGGVLEHPAQSRLWRDMGLPLPGMLADGKGGFTLSVKQCQWGHRATKPTWLYVCGCSPEDVPPIPDGPDEGTHNIAQDRRAGVASVNIGKPRLPTWEREATPSAFAKWLVTLARLCKPNRELTGGTSGPASVGGIGRGPGKGEG
jgi:hypothetical protein